MTTIYDGWWEVPWYLLPATALSDLEYPRVATGEPVAYVNVRENWRGKRDTIALYDARACPPTKASAAQLAVAAARAGAGSDRRRVCTDCGAHCQRPLPRLDPGELAGAAGIPGGSRRMCPACRHLALLQAAQASLAEARAACTARAAELLAHPDSAIVQVDLHLPPPTPAGRARPATAAHVRAVDLDGRRLVKVWVRLVGLRAHLVPDGAIDRAKATPRIHRALGERRLLVWDGAEVGHLRAVLDEGSVPGALPRLPLPYELAGWWTHHGNLGATWLNRPITPEIRAVALRLLATTWRGQLDPHTRELIPCLAPGTPDRLLLLLRRIAHTQPHTQPQAVPTTTTDAGEVAANG